MANIKKYKKTYLFATAILLAGSMIAPSNAYASIDMNDELSGQAAQNYDSKYITRMPDISATQAFIMDENGNEVFSRQADQQIKIASMTKIMTAIVASDYSPDTIIEVNRLAAETPGSTANILAGDKIALSELYKGLLLPSGNDAAYAIAYHLGGLMLDAEGQPKDDQQACLKSFVKAMNDKATELGMTDTVFENPCGLDDGGYEGDQHSTVKDVAKMSLAAMRIQTIVDVVDESSSDMLVDRGGVGVTVPQENTNDLLLKRNDAEGIKTGHTDLAGYCFAGSFAGRNGKTYISVTAGCNSYDDVFDNTETLWDWTNDAWQVYDLISSLPTDDTTGKKSIGSLAVPEWNDKRVKGVIDGDIRYGKWFWQSQPADYSIESDVPEGEIKQGDDIGDIIFRDNDGNEIARADILAAEDVNEPGIFDRISIFFTRFLDTLTSSDTRAKDQFNKIGAAQQITSETLNAESTGVQPSDATNGIKDNTITQ